MADGSRDGGAGSGSDPGPGPIPVPRAALEQYARVTRYDSPYPAHDRGRAVDLYPDRPGSVPSPVAGTVTATRRVRAPASGVGGPHDHLVVLDVDAEHSPWPATARGLQARLLHVDPRVAPGDRVAVGDPLGEPVRSGFFDPWVRPHVHLGLRPAGADAVRASGSLPLRLDAPVAAVPWDGTGTVVRTTETAAVLDAPGHPDPGNTLAGLATADGRVLDGGLPHYDHGGLPAGAAAPLTDARDRPDADGNPDPPAATGRGAGPGGEPVRFLGARVGTARADHVAWDDVTVRVDGTPVRGLALSLGTRTLGAKLVCPDLAIAAGDAVRVTVTRPD